MTIIESSKIRYYPDGSIEEISGPQDFVNEIRKKKHSAKDEDKKTVEVRVKSWVSDNHIIFSLIVFAFFGILGYFLASNYPSIRYLLDGKERESLGHVKEFFWVIAFIWSAFLALYAFIIHGSFININEPESNRFGYGKVRISRIVHQFTLNFLGAIAGWIILFLFWSGYIRDIKLWESLILLLVSFFSITGYLPYVLIKRGWFSGDKPNF